MSLLAAAMAGGAAGAGAGLAQVGAAQTKFLDEQSLMKMRSDLDMEREQTLAALRHQFGKDEATHVSGLRREEMAETDRLTRARTEWETTDPTLTANRRAVKVADAQAEIDLKTKPENVEATARAEGLVQRAKSENTAYDLSPGQRRMIGDKVMGENKRMTSAEASLSLYREGLKGPRAGGAGADKLAPKDKALLSSIEDDEKQLGRSIQSITEKMLKAREKIEQDTMADPAKINELVQRVVAPYQAELNPLREQLGEVRRSKFQFMIDKGMADPEFVANRALLSKDPAVVKQVIEDSYQFGGKWGDAVKQVVEKSGFLAEREAADARESAGRRAVRTEDAKIAPEPAKPSLLNQARGEKPSLQERGQSLEAQRAQELAQVTQAAREALASNDLRTLTEIQGRRVYGALPKDLRTQIYQAVNR